MHAETKFVASRSSIKVRIVSGKHYPGGQLSSKRFREMARHERRRPVTGDREFVVIGFGVPCARGLERAIGSEWVRLADKSSCREGPLDLTSPNIVPASMR